MTFTIVQSNISVIKGRERKMIRKANTEMFINREC